MEIRSIKRVSVCEQVFLQLRDMLIQGEWKQGDRIPSESEMSEMFGVSKITIRQALQKLSTLDLIETRFGEGSFVKRVRPGDSMKGLIPTVYLSTGNYFSVQEYRTIMEVESVRLATLRQQDGDIEELEEFLRIMKNSVEAASVYAEADLGFHFKIREMTKNDLVIKSMEILKEVLRNAMNEIVKDTGCSDGIYYHEKIINAMKRRDADEAVNLMREHLNKNRDFYRDHESCEGLK